jgi:hypothetical protein
MARSTGSIMKTFPAEFLNVDFDIKSKTDPAILVEAWGARVIGIHTARLGRRYWLRLSLFPQPKSPTDAIRRFAKLVRGLSSQARTVWAQASKEIDIGIQAGFERRSGEWVLDPKVVQAAADMGAHLRFTVYSPLLIIDEARQTKTSLRRKRGSRRRS